MSDPTGALLDAAAVARTVVAHPAVAARWASPSALAGFTVGGVAAHLYLATRRTEAVLDESPPASPTLADLAAFYGANRVGSPEDLATGLHPFVRESAEERAAAGPAEVAERFAGLVDRLAQRLPGEPMDRLVSVLQVPNGATPLGTYLVTRVVELVVHTDDLAVSAGIEPPAPPPEAASAVLGAFVELARARNGDLAVVRAFARVERADPEALRVL